MAIEVVTSWCTLMLYAKQVGEARITTRDYPSPENEHALQEAIARHDDYLQICLEADRMIDSPDLMM